MTTIHKNIAALVILVVAFVGGYFIIHSKTQVAAPVDVSAQNVTLSGNFGCLPHMNTSGPQTDECAFGLETDDGVWYAVNFGQSGASMEQFQSGAHIKADGFVVVKEALSSNQWAKYNMKGIFTITKMIEPAPAVSSKLNMNVVCESALSYMTFTDSKSADAYVAECKEGKHPEVIEHYKTQMNLGDGAAI